MADIGRILYLPPPSVPAGAVERRDDRRDNERPVAPAAPNDDANAGSARAKHFRFRVYDGGRPDEALAGDNGLPSRRAGNVRDEDAAAARAARTASGGTDDRAANRSASADLTTASAPFLAQLIAQEQLRPGLHDPPLQAADRAYRQAGGDPPLKTGSVNPRFQLAV